MSNFAEDSYFFDSKAALRMARQQNRVDVGIPGVEGLQVCYYDGDVIKNAPQNCINVPLNDLFLYFVTTKNRIPTFIDFSYKDFSVEMQHSIQNSIQEIFDSVFNKRNQISSVLYQARKNIEPDFNHGLRFFMATSRETQVLQYICMNIANAIQKMGHAVFISMEDNNMQKLHNFHHAKDYLEFKPNIIINISNFNNMSLHEDAFNFIWLQDPIDEIMNDQPIFLRKRDVVFSLTDGIQGMLDKKNIRSKIQSFLINTDIYKERVDISKKKKIVFIGSSYSARIEKYKKDNDFVKVFKEIKEIFEEKSCLTDLRHKDSDIRKLMLKYNKTENYIGEIYGYVARDYCIEKLCNIKQSNYEIEIYGYGWDSNGIVKKFHKGILEYGEDISKIYNSATYGYCVGGYIFMQRTLECACSGTIPLVLDVRADKQDGEYDKKAEKCMNFFHIKDLEKILNEDPPKNLDFNVIRSSYGYEAFVNKCINTVKECLGEI